MDREQRYRTGDTPWEKGAPAPPLLDWIRERGALNGSIQVLGCGSGYDVRALAAAAPAAEVEESSVSVPRTRGPRDRTFAKALYGRAVLSKMTVG